MPFSVVLLCVLLVGGPSSSPGQEASVVGIVTDRAGMAIAEARIELSGRGAARTTRSGPDGRFRLVFLEPGQYRLTVTRAGFRAAEHLGLQVSLGDVVTVPVVLDLAGVEETVDVRERRRSAPSGVTVTDRDLQSLPTSRDPAGLLASVPGAVVDRVDVGGSESLTPLQFIYRGTRTVDTAWTIDGIVVTDRQTGRAPGYYDVGALAEVQLAPAGHDITRPGSGLGVNLVVRSGTNDLRGSARGFFSGRALQSGPREPRRDHTQQVHDLGIDLGGPLYRRRAWFMASASSRDVRLFRLASGDERAEATPRSIKVNWQVTESDRLNLLWLDHAERRFGINPSGLRATPTALQDQFPWSPDTPFRGLWKIENTRTAGPLAVSARYAYYATGFQLLSRGDGPAAVSQAAGEAIGATASSWSTRPQHTLGVDLSMFRTLARVGHEIRLGGGWQRVDMHNRTQWPGDGIVGFDVSPWNRRARIYREADAHSRLHFAHAYLSDTLTRDRLTVDVGLRLDHQRGEALPGRLEANTAFPDLVPAASFTGSTTAAWVDLSPRASARVGLNEGGTLALRGSFGRFASQQVMAALVQTNPANTNAWVEFPWDDHDGDRLAQASEVRTDLPWLAFDGVNPLDPASIQASITLDPGLKSRMTMAWSAGIEAAGEEWHASVSYHDARHTNWPALQWDGITTADYLLVSMLSVTLPNGSSMEVPAYSPDPGRVLANGARRTFVTDPHYYSSYRGIDAAVKRSAPGWTLGATAAWNDSRAFYTQSPAANSIGNPTRLDGSSGGQLTGPKDPLVQGGQIAPSTLPVAGGGRIFMNARWQVTAAATARLPWGFETAATLSGREGHPSPYFVTQNLGFDGNRPVLVTPKIDSVRLDDLWTVDARLSRTVRLARVRVQLLADVFNLLDADTALVTDRNLRSTSVGRVNMQVSPRILRLGLRIDY